MANTGVQSTARFTPSAGWEVDQRLPGVFELIHSNDTCLPCSIMTEDWKHVIVRGQGREWGLSLGGRGPGLAEWEHPCLSWLCSKPILYQAN